MDATSDRLASPLEIAIGRALAVYLHPIAAWRARSAYRRLLLCTGCFAASYLVVLVVLRYLSPLWRP